MKIFIYEYICGGGLAGQPLPESLAQEGSAMLASIVEDFARIQSCEVITTLDERFAGRPLMASHIRQITAPATRSLLMLGPNRLERDVFVELAGKTDWSLVIAPETDNV